MHGWSLAGAKHVGNVGAHVLAGIKPTRVGFPRRCRLRPEVCHVHATQPDWRLAWRTGADCRGQGDLPRHRQTDEFTRYAGIIEYYVMPSYVFWELLYTVHSVVLSGHIGATVVACLANLHFLCIVRLSGTRTAYGNKAVFHLSCKLSINNKVVIKDLRTEVRHKELGSEDKDL